MKFETIMIIVLTLALLSMFGVAYLQDQEIKSLEQGLEMAIFYTDAYSDQLQYCLDKFNINYDSFLYEYLEQPF